jgi:hypothetical protein
MSEDYKKVFYSYVEAVSALMQKYECPSWIPMGKIEET